MPADTWDGKEHDRQIREFLTKLPANRFPLITAHVAELAEGTAPSVSVRGWI